MGWSRLQGDDWYDIVIFRYLLSVKNWMQRPELHKYKFQTIVNRAMLAAVYNEKAKQSRRIQVFSLEENIPGNDDITYMDIVTEDNLDYINYGEYDAAVFQKKSRKTKQEDVFAVEAFLKDGGRKDLRLTYSTREEAIQRSKALYAYRRFHGLREKIRISREDKIIYVVKIEGGKN
ncbi:hypothetical protein [Sporofaciens musculi]|uniref:hypothetical protein n=1 Tax=Sporofaciens musculi TaxID=2681861 RepID=UPI00259D29BD|nr:hypothetical protein [Sporofaciens musculi]